MSKFDYSTFYGGDDELAVSKEKYTKEHLYGASIKQERMKI